MSNMHTYTFAGEDARRLDKYVAVKSKDNEFGMFGRYNGVNYYGDRFICHAITGIFE
jgi:hypothetical protein